MDTNEREYKTPNPTAIDADKFFERYHPGCSLSDLRIWPARHIPRLRDNGCFI
jgi:hypothetical protein